MSSLAKAVSFDASTLWVDFADGRRLGVPLAYFPRLLNAAPDQRERYEISGGGSGLHWGELNEDISVENLLLGIGDRTQKHLMAA
ncbi:MAG: DUF2442 domain-containing protein [Candidatus Ferrigenium altingense]|jgi:hypothetical protein